MAAFTGGKPQAFYRLQDDIRLFIHIIIAPARQKSEIQVPQIMKYGAVAGKTAGKIPAVRLQLLCPAFLPGILVPSDDHRPFILPQIKNTFVPPAWYIRYSSSPIF